MDFHLLWKMSWQAPDSTKDVGQVSFFLVMIVSIFLHFIFVQVPGYWVRLFGRLLMVPIVSGVSFELIQWAGRTDSRLADI